MLDGHNLFVDQEATYGKSWNLDAFLAGYDKPFIIVGLECDHRGNNRLNEYAPGIIPGHRQVPFMAGEKSCLSGSSGS